MNKLLAILLGMCALGAFAVSQLDSFQTQDVGRTGNPMGAPHLYFNSRAEKMGFVGFGMVCMGASLFFIVRTRRDDLRR